MKKLLLLITVTVALGLVLASCGGPEKFEEDIMRGEYQNAIRDYSKYIQGSSERENEAKILLEEHLSRGLENFLNNNISESEIDSTLEFIYTVDSGVDFEKYLDDIIARLAKHEVPDSKVGHVIELFEKISEKMDIDSDKLSDSREKYESIMAYRTICEDAISEYKEENYEKATEMLVEVLGKIDESDEWTRERARNYKNCAQKRLMIEKLKAELQEKINSGRYSQEYIDIEKEKIEIEEDLCKLDENMPSYYWAEEK